MGLISIVLYTCGEQRLDFPNDATLDGEESVTGRGTTQIVIKSFISFCSDETKEQLTKTET